MLAFKLLISVDAALFRPWRTLELGSCVYQRPGDSVGRVARALEQRPLQRQTRPKPAIMNTKPNSEAASTPEIA
jgi:hypothetical protein